jgi:hypothetical protein
MNIRTALPVLALTVALGAAVIAPAGATVHRDGRTWSAPSPEKKMRGVTAAAPLWRGPGGW